LVAMALAQKLAQFNKQQEKLQASLAKTAPRPQPTAKAGPSSRKPPTPPPPTTQLVPFAQRYSFTNDTEKLQQIATIRKSPVGAQIKRVLDLLLETRQAMLPDEINDACFVDVKNHKEVFESLKSNVKVSFDGQRFAFKAKHDLKGKAELLVLIRKVPEGLPMSDLKDSYTGVTTDIQVEYMFITCHMANSWWVSMIFNFTFAQFTIVAIWLELWLLMSI
jgi:transcription initiation factor TFIIE subunit beta